VFLGIGAAARCPELFEFRSPVDLVCLGHNAGRAGVPRHRQRSTSPSEDGAGQLLEALRAQSPGPERDDAAILNMRFMAELWTFLRIRRKLWLLPIILLLLAAGGLLVLAEGAAVAPFIYTLF
jgi:hypothetical protein